MLTPSSDTAWIDERDLGTFLKARHGRTAALFAAWIVKDLVRAGIPMTRYRRERYRSDGTSIGPDLRISLESALLVADIFDAAHTAGLRVLALRRAGLRPPEDDDRLLEVLDLMLSAGCDAPPPGGA